MRIVVAGAAQAPSITLNVTSSAPVWFFCAQQGHCSQGMVGAINAPKSGPKTFVLPLRISLAAVLQVRCVPSSRDGWSERQLDDGQLHLQL